MTWGSPRGLPGKTGIPNPNIDFVCTSTTSHLHLFSNRQKDTRIVLVEDDLVARSDELAHRQQGLMYINDLEIIRNQLLAPEDVLASESFSPGFHHHAAICHLVLETNPV